MNPVTEFFDPTIFLRNLEKYSPVLSLQFNYVKIINDIAVNKIVKRTFVCPFDGNKCDFLNEILPDRE